MDICVSGCIILSGGIFYIKWASLVSLVGLVCHTSHEPPKIEIMNQTRLLNQYLPRYQFHILIYAFIERSREHLNAHNAEDEPENQTHHQHVQDTGYGLDQSVHNNL